MFLVYYFNVGFFLCIKNEKISPLLQIKLTKFSTVLLCEKQIIFLIMIQLLSLKEKNLESEWKTSFKYSLFQATGLTSTCCSSFILFFILFSQTMTNFNLAFYLGAKDAGKISLITRHIWTNMKGTVWNNPYVQGKKVCFCYACWITSQENEYEPSLCMHLW